MHLKEWTKLPSKKPDQETGRERAHGSKPAQKDLQFSKTALTSSPDNDGLHGVSATLYSHLPDLSSVFITYNKC